MAISGLPTTSGNDVVTVSPTGTYTVDAGDGLDRLVVNYGTLSQDVLYYYVGGGYFTYTDEFLTSITFVNFDVYDVTTGSGDDLLVGGGLADVLRSGTGNDRIESGLGADTVDGSGGIDRWSSDYSSLGTSFRLVLAATGTSEIQGSGARLTGIEAITFTTAGGNDNIDTSALVGNDTVNTNNGNDTVALGRGIDNANGGDGTDILVMDWSGLTDPNAWITNTYIGGGWFRYSAAGQSQLDYVNFDRYFLTGARGSDWLGGGALADSLVGGDGNDTLSSGAGADTVRGDAGLDTWVVDTTSWAGRVTVNLVTQKTTYGAVLSGIEQLSYAGGNSSDTVTAMAGVYNDTIYTGDGKDVVTTGRGIDVTDGGAGTNDVLIMDWSGITDPRFNILNRYVGGGWSEYYSASGDKLSYVSYESYKMTGGAGDDWLGGGDLRDTLIGGAGNDTLVGGKAGGLVSGNDGIDLWSANLSEAGQLNFSAAASQTTAQGGTVGLQVRGIERVELWTGNGNDKVSTQGFASNDWVALNAGNDRFDGGLGRDTADGGASDGDILIVGYGTATAAVTGIYLGGGWSRWGIADGSASVDWVNFERFDITSGSGHDSLYGAGGNDTLRGGGGNDTLNGVAGSDVIDGNGGRDLWQANYSGLDQTIALTLNASGNGTVNGTGTTLSGIESVSIGTGNGNDRFNLSAQTGNDTISSGLGDDIIDIGRGYFEEVNAGDGTDTLTMDAGLAAAGVRMSDIGGGWTQALANDGSYRAIMYSIEHFNFIGSGRNDRAYGFAGEDTLNGKAGADVLNGGAGNDVLTGGGGADAFVFDVGSAGRDRITDAKAGDLITLRGVTLDGTLVSGSGDGLGAGQVAVSNAGGVTTVAVGLDGNPGAEFFVDLTGAFGTGDFQIIGNQLLLV